MNKSSKTKDRKTIFTVAIVSGLVLLIICGCVSVLFGASRFQWKMVMEVIRDYDVTNPKHIIITKMRIPRILAATLIGSALAVAGAVMQGLTKNPLGDSGLMGLNAGAILVVAITYAYFHSIGYSTMLLLAFLGAGLSAGAVYLISYLAPGENMSMKLILAGATISSLFTSLSQGVSIIAEVSQNVSFWTMGSVVSVNWHQLMVATPFLLVGIIVCIIISSQVTLISMGDDTAKGLGVNVDVIRVVGIVSVVVLSGTSVALGGMIAFVGIIIPHLCRHVVGNDYRYIIPMSAVYGAVLLVIADIGAKTLNPPTEIPIGAITAVLGMPIFLMVARRLKAK